MISTDAAGGIASTVHPVSGHPLEKIPAAKPASVNNLEPEVQSRANVAARATAVSTGEYTSKAVPKPPDSNVGTHVNALA